MSSGMKPAVRIEILFSVMTEAGFPHGLRCETCDRSIIPGQPYVEDVVAMAQEGATITLTRCVYCPLITSF